MRVAVIGAGISGLVSAHELSREHHVEVFERENRLGGHTHTHRVAEEGRVLAIDSGFIVFNDRNYPNFSRLLKKLGVASQPSNMSFSVRDERDGLEYNGTSLNALFAQRRNLLRPRFLRMLREILAFNAQAKRLVQTNSRETMAEFLARNGFGDAFREQYLLPMAAAVWSVPPADVLEFPARSLACFFENHGFLNVDDRPQWRTIVGGSSSYIEPLCRPFAAGVHLGATLARVERSDDAVTLRFEDGGTRRFDAVVLATHSDQALALLDRPTPAERAILGAIGYRENRAVLHRDASLLPRRRLARAAWNYHIERAGILDAPRATLSYWMNSLQGLNTSQDYLVTLNRDDRADGFEPSSVIARMTYHHPRFDQAAIDAQALRATISGVGRTHFAGAYWGFGFHEDGVESALAVAREFGIGSAMVARAELECAR